MIRKSSDVESLNSFILKSLELLYIPEDRLFHDGSATQQRDSVLSVSKSSEALMSKTSFSCTSLVTGINKCNNFDTSGNLFVAKSFYVLHCRTKQRSNFVAVFHLQWVKY